MENKARKAFEQKRRSRIRFERIAESAAVSIPEISGFPHPVTKLRQIRS